MQRSGKNEIWNCYIAPENLKGLERDESPKINSSMNGAVVVGKRFEHRPTNLEVQIPPDAGLFGDRTNEVNDWRDRR